MSKILFCIPLPAVKNLGAAKVIVELAEEMQNLGWKYDIVTPSDFPAGAPGVKAFEDSLRGYLRERAGDYDVVDYDHGYLPFPRSEFCGETLFVARSVLLAHHFERIPVPIGRDLKAQARWLLTLPKDRAFRHANTRRAHETVKQADVVNVPSEHDRDELVQCGIPAEKIVVIPFGIDTARRQLFNAVPSDVPATPRVGFVGTFDYRKGAREMPEIFRTIAKDVPFVRFRLLGTSSRFKTEQEVLAHFHPSIRPKIEVIPKFDPNALPDLLSQCSVGVFPSYIEGMPFAVLEMLSASMPVIAYDAPGPPVMLSREYLVKRGDAQGMAKKVVALLRDRDALLTARRWSRARSTEFTWSRAAALTDEAYRTQLQKLRGSLSLHGS